MPLYALLYLSPLITILDPAPNFGQFLYGTTGSLKTTLCVDLLNHWGNYTINNLNNFSDTYGHLSKRAFTLKDTLFLLDDYHPSNQKRDAGNMESTLEKLIRDFANRTSRGRLNADTSDKGRFEPRVMILVTGENLPSIISSLNRLFIINCKKEAKKEDNDFYLDKINSCSFAHFFQPH